ncbi:MAG: pyridine nucleotide-disulfide oxidoreductase [Betaproteobacteria bacterium RIFCSPLOWO2_12_FULL_62_13]|nr:MAG: pyridine nucleotide-disulfide oxidoreductase [Betaproteobacteria bacterium RIFCSPLOWO2_12_FULL_62_13]
MASAKTVLILGGGVGGIVAAMRLRRLLSHEHRVVLVEKEANHVYSPSFLWLMIGERDAGEISRPLAALRRRGIELVQGAVERIEPAEQRVYVNGSDLAGDYMIVALGAEYAPETVPGLSEAGHNFYTLAGAASLHAALSKLDSGRIAVLVASMPFKCPAAPNEAAMLLEYDCRRRGVRKNVELDLYTPEPGPMPVAGAQVSAALREMIEAKRIGYHPGHAITNVDPARHRLSFANGAEAGCDLLAYVPPHRAPEVVRQAGMCGESGWMAVDRGTLQTRHPGVYAVGDVTGIMLTSVGKPLPKAGVLAHNQAEVVARNIALAITGRGTARKFGGEGECFIETGDGKAGFGSGSFYTEPEPQIKLRAPSALLHWGKVAYEKYWLWSRF